MTLLNIIDQIKNSGIEWYFSTDSREKHNAWFIALKGDRFDGNEFYKNAIENGAQGLILEKLPKEKLNIPVIIVKNSLQAYQEIAKYHRQNILKNTKVIGITGSNGKTSTKEILTNILNQKYKVISTYANENNQIGVPKTILKATQDTQILIIEMGMRALGEIQELTEITQPNFAVITSIGVAHIGLLESRENIAKAKSEIFTTTNPNLQKIYIPFDENSLIANKNQEFQIFGNFNNFKIEEKSSTSNFIYKKVKYKINSTNLAIIKNACVSIDIAKELGLNSEEIQEGLNQYQSIKGRGQIIKLKSGAILIDESYNANPDSVFFTAKTLESFSNLNRTKTLILGELKELGNNANNLLKELAEKISNLKIDYFLLLDGENQQEFYKYLQIFNTNQDTKIKILKNKNALVQYIKNKELSKFQNILALKASRSAKLEEIIKII